MSLLSHGGNFESERERETETETEREADRQTDRDRERSGNQIMMHSSLVSVIMSLLQ